MLEGYGAVTQALLGTLFTWGMTALGAACVVVIRGTQRKVLDASLGFAAGVMIAASYWSLLSPAITLSKESGLYGETGLWAFVPVAFGFLLGAAFVYGTDIFLDYLGINSPNMMIAMTKSNKSKSKNKIDEDILETTRRNSGNIPMSVVTVETAGDGLDSFNDCINNQHSGNNNSFNRRRVGQSNRHSATENVQTFEDLTSSAQQAMEQRQSQWKRIMLLVVAITVHNIPEGLAVGVGFGAVGTSSTATFQSARNLAIGIGIQNFPEGLAVSLPLQAGGFSVWNSFWFGQLSGMVEPVFGVLGAVAVAAAQPILPYALAFAAGAMIYVVADDIIPEANTSGNGKLATFGCIVGFVIMMCLDVGLE